MMVKMKKYTILLTFILISCASQEPEIKIGFIGPLSGNAAVFGIVEKNAVEIALEEINYTIAGKKATVLYEDGQCDATRAVTAAQKLIEIDEVQILLSVCSAETLAVSPLAERNKILLITAYASNPSISQAGDYIFRTSYSDEDAGKVLANALQKYSTIGILTEQNDYSLGLQKTVLNNRNKTAITEEFKQDVNVRTQLLKLLDGKPDALFINTETPQTGLAAIQQARLLGFNGQLFGNYFGTDKEIQQSNEAQGLVFISDPEINNNLLRSQFLNKYHKKVGETPAFEFAAISRYDNLQILKQAIETVGIDPTAIKDYLYSLESFTGALGTYHFDENGDIVGVRPSLKQIVNKTAVAFEP